MIIVNAFGNECMNTEVFEPSYKVVVMSSPYDDRDKAKSMFSSTSQEI